MSIYTTMPLIQETFIINDVFQVFVGVFTILLHTNDYYFILYIIFTDTRNVRNRIILAIIERLFVIKSFDLE